MTPTPARRPPRTLALALALTLAAPPLAADPPTPPLDALLGQPLSAAEFEAQVTGRVLTYALDGLPWGQEAYHPGRRVTWAFTGQSCEEGYWHPRGPAICFVYQATPGPNCWLFFQGDGGLVARSLGAGNRLSEVSRSPGPMDCGPKVGV